MRPLGSPRQPRLAEVAPIGAAPAPDAAAVQVLDSQRMEAVGRMASGVAHDFNNLLNLILGYAELLEAGLAPDDPRRDEVAGIGAAAQRAGALARRLLACAGSGSRPCDVDLSDLISRLRALLESAAGDGIELHLDLDPDTPPVRADPSDIERVLINLVLNARDAMPSGGAIEVRTRPTGGADDVGGRRAELVVADTGHGIDPGVLPTIFDPFVTTKGDGGGTGLGLWTAKALVEAMGGRVAVDSAVGDGAAFTIHLPCLDGETWEGPAREQQLDLRGSG